jgi:predicted ATPase
LPEFRPVFDALSTMGFYNISPAKIRELQAPDQGDLMDREGTNLASVLDRLSKASTDAKRRIEEYLARVVPGIEGLDAARVGHMETIEFRQRVVGSKEPWRFPAINMSDGTLRALAVLTALFQFGERNTARLIGIEEPETALHPAAAGLLLDCLREGARERQVVITTHSPDLLDNEDITAEQLLAVSALDGKTTIGRIDDASRRALRDSLYRAGELLRLNQLEPEPSSTSEAEQLDLFGST